MEFDATFIIAAISFIVFVFIMNKIFYAPILNIMNERSKVVEANYNNAKLITEETQKQIKYHENELEKSREEARLKVSQQSQQLKQEKYKAISEYKNALSDNIAKEKENLENSANDAKEVLKDNIVDIAKEISDKLLGSDIDSNLINKSQIKEFQG